MLRIAFVRRCLGLFLAGLCVFAASAELAQAERPAAPHMLPENTVVYVRARDTRELVEKFNETGMGRILADEQVKPLVSQIYGTLGEAFARETEDENLGVSLEAILTLPQGEVVFAMIAPKGETPVFIGWMDAGTSAPAMRKLLERGEEELRNTAGQISTEKVGDIEVRIVEPANDDGLVYFEKDNTFVFATNVDLAKEFIDRWDSAGAEGDKEDDEEVETLASNQEFTTIMNRCRGGKSEPPQLTWFVDPVNLARSATRGNTGAQTAIAFLPVIGVDGLKGIGGSSTLATDDFDMINHLHVLTDSPRRGVLKMVAFESGDTKPEPWVPGDVVTYTTVHWDLDETYRELATIVDSFRGENFTLNWINERTEEAIGAEFEADLLEQFGGRVSMATWYERPIKFGSEIRVIAIDIEDEKKMQKLIDNVSKLYPDAIEKTTYGSQSIYKVEGPRAQARAAAQQAENPEVQVAVAFEPCFMLRGKRLFVSTKPVGLHKVIGAESNAADSLAGKLDFKLIASKIRRQAGGTKPAMLTFNRPSEAMRAAYDFVQSDQVKDGLASAAEDDEFVQSLQAAMEKHPLPPFAVIEQYLAPGGGMIVADETGFHYTGFTLKRKK